MKSRVKPAVETGWLEGVLWLTVTLLLVCLSLYVSVRIEAALDRYSLDHFMGRLIGEPLLQIDNSMVGEWQRDLGCLVVKEESDGQTATSSLMAKPGELAEQSLRFWRKNFSKGKVPCKETGEFAPLLEKQFVLQEKRYHDLLSVIASINTGGVDLTSASAAYIAPSNEDPKGIVPEQISAQYETQLLEYGRRKKIADQLSASSFSNAFRKYQAQYQEAKSDLARAEILGESARLLDGRKPSEDSNTIKYILDVPRISQRALQAIMLVKNGWLLWLCFSVWLWLAIQVGRRVTHRRLLALSVLLIAALLVAFCLQFWAGITAPYWLLPLGGGIAAACIVCDRLMVFSRSSGLAEDLFHDVSSRRVGVSPWLLPGWFAFVGIGWFLLVDLSLHFHPKLRFLMVDHIEGLWGAVLLMGLIPLLAPLLLLRVTRVLGLIFSPRHWGRWPGFLALFVFVPVVWWGGNSEQYITGEIIKAVFILLAAWFFVMRGPLLLHGRNVIKGFNDIFLAIFPALVILGALSVSLVITRDLGPLLVILLCSCLLGGGFWGLITSTVMTISLFACIVWAGKTLPTVGGRVQSYLDPFGAVIDDMARLLWFQKEVPLLGFGFGNVPWRGYSFKDSSVGLPLQLQSDYTFTGLMGEFGVGAWVLVGLVAFWGLELARAHARKAPVDTCSLMAGGVALRDGFRSWLALVFGCLLTVQTALTVSGNLALVPLTGITLPWMSFGNTALWIMTLFFALLVDVNMEESRQ